MIIVMLFLHSKDGHYDSWLTNSTTRLDDVALNILLLEEVVR